MVSCGHRKWSFPFDSKQLLHMSPHSIAKTTFMKLWANLREFGILFIAINGRFCIGHPCIFTGRLGQRFAWTKKHPQAWLVKNGFHSRYLVQLDAKSSKSDFFFNHWNTPSIQGNTEVPIIGTSSAMLLKVSHVSRNDLAARKASQCDQVLIIVSGWWLKPL